MDYRINKDIARESTAKRRRSTKQTPGFTLIEVMVVLAIIGVLSALIVPNVLSRLDDARVMAARTDIASLSSALRLYKLDNGGYPSNAQGLEALVERPSEGAVPPNWRQYVQSLPRDPWGRSYVYLNPGVHNDVDVVSYGSDGVPGGEDADADIFAK